MSLLVLWEAFHTKPHRALNGFYIPFSEGTPISSINATSHKTPLIGDWLQFEQMDKRQIDDLFL